MGTPVFHRSRAERFAALLDEADGGRGRHHVRSEADEELARLVALGVRIRQINPRIAPDKNFRAELRAMLVATAERESADATVVLPEVTRPPATRGRLAELRSAPRRLVGTPGRRARTRAAVIAGVAAGTLALSGMSAASGDAVPGDALYGLKRSTERAQLALAGSDVSRGQLYLEFAKTRVAEASAVKSDEASFVGVLGDMDAATRQGVKLLTSAAVSGHNPVALDVIDHFVEAQRQSLAKLLGQTQAEARVRDSLALLDEIAERARALRTTLACGSRSGSDALGALPNTCGTAIGHGARSPQRDERRAETGRRAARQASEAQGGSERQGPGPPSAATAAPSEATTPPSEATTPPDEATAASGQAKSPPGQAKTPPGQAKTPPRPSEEGVHVLTDRASIVWAGRGGDPPARRSLPSHR